MGLQEFEQRLERLVEETLAKPFRSNLQPVEIGRRLTRRWTCTDGSACMASSRPMSFMVLLATRTWTGSAISSTPCAGSSPTRPGSTPGSRGTSSWGRCEVEIVEGNRLRPGRFTVTAEVVEGPDGLVFAELVLPDGQRLTVGTEPVVIGRLPECDIVLSDPNVSRRHAEVRRSGDEVVVADLESTNGTRVNGVPIREQRLENGDEITVGTTTLRFEIVVTAGGPMVILATTDNTAILRPLQWLVVIARSGCSSCGSSGPSGWRFGRPGPGQPAPGAERKAERQQTRSRRRQRRELHLKVIEPRGLPGQPCTTSATR